MRGPFPRGQCVQFDKCNSSVLEDFSCENDLNRSWTEDNVNVFESDNVTLRRVHRLRHRFGPSPTLSKGYLSSVPPRTRGEVCFT